MWLGLLVIELTSGLSRPLEWLTYAIWGVFILDFMVEILIAPDRTRYLRTHWLTVISLVLPAARVLRVTRLVRVVSAARASRSLGLLRVLTAINRGIGALGRTLARRGLGYVLAITALVALAGAAGMLAFEGPEALAASGQGEAAMRGDGLSDYPEAIWWTLMILVTIGSDYWPVTAEGRILTLLLSLYGFAVFGYITASIASHFLGQDRPGAAGRHPVQGTDAEIRGLREEVRALREELRTTRAG